MAAVQDPGPFNGSGEEIGSLKLRTASLAEEVKSLKATVSEEVAAKDTIYKPATAASQRVVVARSELLALLRVMSEEAVKSHRTV